MANCAGAAMMHLPLRTLATVSPARMSSVLSAWMLLMGAAVAMIILSVHMAIHSALITREKNETNQAWRISPGSIFHHCTSGNDGNYGMGGRWDAIK